MTEAGGGASQSTDPAAGTSSATDVSLREYLIAQIRALDRQLTSDIEALGALVATQREGDQLAVRTALETAQALAEKHNDLIRAGEKEDETYATKEDVNRISAWQSKLSGGLLVVTLIGVTNLVKVWTG